MKYRLNNTSSHKEGSNIMTTKAQMAARAKAEEIFKAAIDKAKIIQRETIEAANSTYDKVATAAMVEWIKDSKKTL